MWQTSRSYFAATIRAQTPLQAGSLGCPLLVNAVQVSRNTDTGQCYLQLKLSNISGATVDSFKLQADVSYVDGASETVELNPSTPTSSQPRRIVPNRFHLLVRKSPTLSSAFSLSLNLK